MFPENTGETVMKQIIENTFIEKLAKSFSRSPLQQNKINESDAELLRIPGNDHTLALTTDSIVEEIERGLYSDPYLIGWMTVIVNLSDLAAVGAEPIGILINESLPSGLSSEYIEMLQQGINDACNKYHIHVLGGDTNLSSSMQMGASAVGIIRNGTALTRVGCTAGDHLFSSGRLGIGSVYAINKLFNISNDNKSLFKPNARIEEGQLLRQFASCCIDTSDGFIPAIDQLMRLNNTGFTLETDIEDLLCPETHDISIKADLKPWMMLAGPHGEFELIFTVRANKLDNFLNNARAMDWEPLFLGKATGDQRFKITSNNKIIEIDTPEIRNLFNKVNGNVERYIQELLLFKY